MHPSLVRRLLKPGRPSPGHQWQGDSSIVLLPQVLGSDHRRGGTPGIQRMGTGTWATFNAYISDCLTQENNNNKYSASKSRKRAFEAGSSQSRAPVVGRQQYRPPAPGARFRPPQRRNTGHPTQQKPYKVAIAPAKPKAIQATTHAANNMTKGSCYNCHKMGHFAKECPYPKRQQTTVDTS